MGDLEENWSIVDIAQAHDVLDALEHAENEAHKRARKESEARRNDR